MVRKWPNSKGNDPSLEFLLLDTHIYAYYTYFYLLEEKLHCMYLVIIFSIEIYDFTKDTAFKKVIDMMAKIIPAVVAYKFMLSRLN